MSVIIDKVERRRAQLECDVSEWGTMRNRNAELDTRWIARTPLGRLGTVDDIAKIICVLVGDESGFKRRETENPKPRSNRPWLFSLRDLLRYHSDLVARQIVHSDWKR